MKTAKELGQEPAYPASIVGCGGLTKREAFALAAMQGIVTNQSLIDAIVKSTPEWVAGEAKAMADALLAELAKEQL